MHSKILKVVCMHCNKNNGATTKLKKGLILSSGFIRDLIFF